ncbi:MAG: GGDEF domain-containing protein [Lachnospiraceae bacterium]|nr:GGDEF domain-containing protein [Lachnospiraceae bacterium]
MKRIIYVLNDSRRSFTYERISGLCEAVKKASEPTNLYIFRSAGFSGYDPSHNCGEYNIYRLPDFADYDGIILDINNVNVSSKNEYEAKGTSYIVEAAASSGKPVISVANRMDGFYFLGIDNRRSMTSVVSFLHDSFYFTDFWFIMGPSDNYENIMRTEAIRAYCKENGIPSDILRFYSESYAIDCGIHGFEKLYSINGGKLPQAIVCANDPIALGVLRTASSRGIKIPGDVYVTGFDNLDISAYHSPSITTIDQHQPELGQKCMDIFERIWAGEDVDKINYINTTLVERETTGGPKPPVNTLKTRVAVSAENDMYTEKFNDRICTMQYKIPTCKSIDEICRALEPCIPDMKCMGIWLAIDRKLSDLDSQTEIDLKTGSIRLNDSALLSEGYPESMELVYVWDKKTGSNFPHETISSLFPTFDHARGGRNYMFIPLHFMESTVGFLVISNGLNLLRTRNIASFVNTLTMALRNFFSSQKLEYVNHLLSGISMRDNLTGLCNRLGYHHLAARLFEDFARSMKKLGIIFIDMDRMKWFNDTFGHACGDDAIRSLAFSISKNISEGSIAVRFGGDEFLILTPVKEAADAEMLIGRIEEALPSEAGMLKLPDVPGISAGFVITDPAEGKTLNEYVEEADRLMYDIKKAKRSASTQSYRS